MAVYILIVIFQLKQPDLHLYTRIKLISVCRILKYVHEDIGKVCMFLVQFNCLGK